MDNDNVYPSDGGAFFGAPAETDQRVEQEVADVLAQVPLLKAHVDYLNQKIAFYGDIDSIAVDLDKDPEGHRRQVAVNKLLKGELLALKGDIETRVEAAMKQRR